MKTYYISFKYSRNGSSWTITSRSVRAESDYGAIRQIESMYPYVKDIKVQSVR